MQHMRNGPARRRGRRRIATLDQIRDLAGQERRDRHAAPADGVGVAQPLGSIRVAQAKRHDLEIRDDVGRILDRAGKRNTVMADLGGFDGAHAAFLDWGDGPRPTRGICARGERPVFQRAV